MAAGEAKRTHRQSTASAVPDAQNLQEISALESRKKGMRKWSTDARIMAFQTQERTGSLFEDFNEEEPAAEEDADPDLPTTSGEEPESLT